MKEVRFEENNLTGEEVKVIYGWLILAIYEGGGVYGNDLRAWFPVIKKLMPSSKFPDVADEIRMIRDESIAEQFLEYVGIKH